jgi:eukaryotic-like serine/threonine-protein kinase
MANPSDLIDPTHIEDSNISKSDDMPTGKEDNLFIGSGKIVGLIGKGGMAAVYKIWNKGLDKFHAIKIAFPDERQNYARFTTEAKIASKLKQTNIVEIKNIGEWKGLPFIEMEFIDGKTLRDLIDERGKFPPAVACAVAIFIARALNHAHSAAISIDGKTYNGIIHRDLKPENIMVSKSGEITVMDLGLARPTQVSLHTTQVQAFIGTPQYAAPEQFGFEKADHRADIYALGEILYEMVSGCKTFTDASITSNATDMDAVLAKCLELKRKK